MARLTTTTADFRIHVHIEWDEPGYGRCRGGDRFLSLSTARAAILEGQALDNASVTVSVFRPNETTPSLVLAR